MPRGRKQGLRCFRLYGLRIVVNTRAEDQRSATRRSPASPCCGDPAPARFPKFPKRGERDDVIGWEALALTLAAQAGLRTAEWRIERPEAASVLVLRRFDRERELRVPFISAMSMLDADDRETRSYMELADALRQHGSEPGAEIGRAHV